MSKQKVKRVLRSLVLAYVIASYPTVISLHLVPNTGVPPDNEAPLHWAEAIAVHAFVILAAPLTAPVVLYVRYCQMLWMGSC